MYNASLIRFEIPGFGLVKMTPENFEKVQKEVTHLSSIGIVYRILNAGYELDILSRPVNNLSRTEWLAVYGECHGHGEA